MSGSDRLTSFSLLPVAVQMEIDSACHEFEQQWLAGTRPDIQSFLDVHEELGRSALLCELLLLDIAYRQQQDEVIELQDYMRQFPADSQVVEELVSRCDSSSAQPDDNFSTDERFYVTDFHAKGGLGQVSRAIDRQFNREVAVKEILGFHANSEESRRRFELEAKVTGLLEHPGIVPIYGMGRKRDGRPYYAMRMIRGDSLADAIEGQYKKGTSRTSELDLRRLLSRFISVCQTVEYAHSRGVIHRDIKPANIMLGPYGETLLVDWGLARLVGESEDRLLIRDPSGIGDGQTRAVIGTPSYMSPEQVRQGRFPTPMEVQPSVPCGLQAICLKAMALHPQQRFPNASELAEDIERWLADEAVTSFRDPLLTRIGRWSRRHRSWVAGGVVLLLATVIGLAIGAVLLDSARQRIDQQRQKTLANLRISRSAVNDLLTNVSEEDLFDRPGLEPVRKHLLERALLHCREFESSVADNPVLRSELSVEIAANVQHIAEIACELHSLDKALAVCQQSVALHESLLNEVPGSLDRQSALADSYDLLAKTQILRKALAEADDSLEKALAIRRQLVAARDSPEDQNRLAATMSESSDGLTTPMNCIMPQSNSASVSRPWIPWHHPKTNPRTFGPVMCGVPCIRWSLPCKQVLPNVTSCCKLRNSTPSETTNRLREFWKLWNPASESCENLPGKKSRSSFIRCFQESA